MTQPVEPNLDPSSPPVSSPLGQQAVDDEIRQLATALAPDPITAMSGHKGVVDSISLGGAGTPPTITVDVGGVLVPGVAIAANYTPQAGDTVVLAKQGNSYVALFRIGAESSKSNEDEGGWTAAGLNAAHATQGSATVMYRRINDHGSWKMQWKGAVDYGSGTTSLLASALDADFRPSVARQCTVARSVTGGESTARIDFNSDGTVTLWGLSRSNDLGYSDYAGGYSHSHGGATGVTDPADGLANAHSHAIFDSSSADHRHYLGTLSIDDPPWVSLDGVEYFL
jgi:hypothetical protein